MHNVRVLLGIGAGLLTAVAVACSSSSSGGPNASAMDAGGDDTSSSGDDGGMAGPGCIPLGSSGCSTGQACCIDPMNFTGGSCVTAGTCTKAINIGCEKTADCSTGQVCCADLGGVDAGALSALAEGGLGALGIDASALSADSGAGGLGAIGGALGNFSLKVGCATSCSSMQIQVCATTSATECSGGSTCVPLTQLAGDAGNGVLGDAGLPPQFAMYAGALGMVGACVPPAAATDSGTMPPGDSGMEDVVVPPDAPTDAPADSPAE
jgi:hypothetical protein